MSSSSTSSGASLPSGVKRFTSGCRTDGGSIASTSGLNTFRLASPLDSLSQLLMHPPFG
jgi:hypothetical protein